MSTSMHVCNPYCGRCKPPREPLLHCPACKAINDPLKGEFGLCKRCGAALPPRKLPEAAYCNRVGAMCANPCGQRDKEPLAAGASCPYFTERYTAGKHSANR